MSNARVPSMVAEPARDRPVLHDDVVVAAGSGLSGTFAAIAAGRSTPSPRETWTSRRPSGDSWPDSLVLGDEARLAALGLR
ncbi:MAG: hypothetical protein ACE5JM_06300 [Armatimonadota bacterium]